jgi:hypothetical protein
MKAAVEPPRKESYFAIWGFPSGKDAAAIS